MKKIKRIFGIFVFLLVLMLGSSHFLFAKNTVQPEESVSAYVTYDYDSSYLTSLASSAATPASSYNLAKLYPMVNENQTTSPFCWIYTSLKSLESAFMVQKGEYYNFSEIGLAYLNYARLKDLGETASFESDGTFMKFVQLYQDNGLVFESDFSNNEYQNILNDNYTSYSYVEDFATKEYNSIIKPYLIYNNSYYSALSTANKRLIIKKFITKYGALFSGIEGGYDSATETYRGCFYVNSSAENDYDRIQEFYSLSRENISNPNNLSGNHAICVVGWNDDVVFGSETGAFIAMNSWGNESTSVNFFYVPYSYTNFYDEFAGFILDTEATENVKVDSAAQSSFSEDILSGTSERELDNYFCYDDDIWVDYKLNLSSIENVRVKVTSGTSDYTKFFSQTRNNKNIKLELDVNDGSFYGGYYTVSFYNNDVLFGKKSIYIYSGTEIGYFKINNTSTIDSFTLNNASLNNDSSATLCFSGPFDYYIMSFNLTNTSEYDTIINSSKSSSRKNFSVTISEASVVCSSNSAKESYSSTTLVNNLFYVATNDNANLFQVQLGINTGLKLSDFYNCLIRFKLTTTSVLYNNCSRDYYFNVYVSSRNNAQTSNLNRIFYELNDGENSKNAVLKYPIFDSSTTGDASMTEVSLPTPTKLNSNFMGWYLNDEFTGDAVTKITNALSGDIVLYAKWDDATVNYCDVDLDVISITKYNNSGTRELSDSIIYGDTIVVRFSFTENAGLSGYNYTVYYYFTGIETVTGYLNLTTKYADFELEFPNLSSGNHTFSVKVVVEIANSFTVTKKKTLPVSVAQKQVAFSFGNLSQTYDGTIKKPTVTLSDDFYAEDKVNKQDSDLFKLTCDIETKNAGTYLYYIENLYNDNYTFDETLSKCSLVVAPKEISISWKPYSQVYDGKNHYPEYDVNGIVNGDSVSFSFTITECIDAGDYTINIRPETITNSNYQAQTAEPFSFTISKATIQIIMHNATDRVQTKLIRRVKPTYTVVGNFYTHEDLQLNIICEALTNTSATSGRYDISCSVGNENYNYTVQKATYTLTGYYYVYYQVVNGNSYSERVEQGEKPTGVTKQQLGLSIFSTISYSDDYNLTGNDIYVDVTVKDYSAEAAIGIAAIVFFGACLIIYLKKRGSNVR